MATDATGTPTPKGIPKYDTANDAPSGLGFNAAMDAIDALLNAYAGNISGIAVGEAPVWNGSAWVRSSVQRIGPSSLGSGTPDSTKFLRGDGTWQAVGAPGFGTTLPGSPADGDEHILVDSITAPTYSWRFRYVSAKASNKWIFIGGSPISSGPAAQGSALTTSYTNQGTATIAIPVTGIYTVSIGARLEADAANPSDRGVLSFSAGGVTEADDDGLWIYSGANTQQDSLWGERQITKTLTGGTAVQPRGKARSSTNMRFDAVTVYVLPVAVGG